MSAIKLTPIVKGVRELRMRDALLNLVSLPLILIGYLVAFVWTLVAWFVRPLAKLIVDAWFIVVESFHNMRSAIQHLRSE